MMPNAFRNLVCLFYLMLFFAGKSFAGVEPYENFIKGKIQKNDSLIVKDEKFKNPQFNWADITNISVQNSISLKILDEQVINRAFSCRVLLKVTYFSDPEQTESTIIDSVALNVNYSRQSGAVYKGKDIYKFKDGYNVKVTVIDISSPEFGSDVPPVLQLTSQIVIDRKYLFRPFLPIGLNGELTGNGKGALNKLASGTSANNQLLLTWEGAIGAEEFDVEWVTIDNNSEWSNLADSMKNNVSSIFDGRINSMFRNNAARITTAEHTYLISLLYNADYIAVRMRQVHYEAGIRVPGEWFYKKESPNEYSIWLLTWHEENLNWQYSAAYAEDGKKKEVVSYFDGTLRGRQTVTLSNSGNDVVSEDETVAVVQENIYDQFGRAAASLLPAPVKEGVKQSLHYFHGFNKNALGKSYSFADLNAENCEPHPAALSNLSGASEYYSGNNKFKEAYLYNKYIPDAGGYPLSVTQYTADNTGRIKIQGGVGPTFQPGTTGESRTTKYFYGKPYQWELDKLFGNDVGSAEHYLKNLVVDPNGQISLSYVNSGGKTIATALSGLVPGNVDSLDNIAVEKWQKTKLLKPDQFTFNGSTLKLSATTTYLATVTGVDTLHYNVEKLISRYPGGAFQPCSNCFYNLTITVTDDCGVSVFLNQEPIKIQPIKIGSDTANCADYGIFTDTLVVPFKSIGAYNLTFEFALDKNVIERFTDSLIHKGQLAGVIKKKRDFILHYFSEASFIDCFSDCKTARTKLGTLSAFTEMFQARLKELGEDPQEYGSYISGLHLSLSNSITALEQNCDLTPLSPCAVYRTAMLADVSPGGQYAMMDSLGNFIEPSINVLTNYFKKGVFNTKASTDLLYKASLVNKDDGTGVTSPYDLNFNIDDLKKYWRPEWAELFLEFHPEYCKLQFCDENTVSMNWDERLRNTDEAEDIPKVAESLTYSYTDNAWLLAADPFFKTAAGSGYLTAMGDDLNKYSTKVLNLNPGTAVEKGLSEFVDFKLYCLDSTSTTHQPVIDRWTNCIPYPACRVKDREWQLYRDMYLDLKQKYFERVRKENACKDICEVGPPIVLPIGGGPGTCNGEFILEVNPVQLTEYEFLYEDTDNKYTYTFIKGTPGEVPNSDNICYNYAPEFYPCLTVNMADGKKRRFNNVWKFVCHEIINNCEYSGSLFFTGQMDYNKFVAIHSAPWQDYKDEFTVFEGYDRYSFPTITDPCNGYPDLLFFDCLDLYDASYSLFRTYKSVWVSMCNSIYNGWGFKNSNAVAAKPTPPTRDQILADNDFVDTDKKTNETVIVDIVSHKIYSIIKADNSPLLKDQFSLSKVNFTKYLFKSNFTVQNSYKAFIKMRNVWVASYVRNPTTVVKTPISGRLASILTPCETTDFMVSTNLDLWTNSIHTTVSYKNGLTCARRDVEVRVFRFKNNEWTHLGSVTIPANQNQASDTFYMPPGDSPDEYDIYQACAINPCSLPPDPIICPDLLSTKRSHFISVNRESAVSNIDTFEIYNGLESQLNDSIGSFCESNADIWMKRLDSGLVGKTATQIALLRSKLIELCALGGDINHPFGASSLPSGSILVNNINCSNFGEVIKAALGSGTTFTNLLNPWVIDSPYPHGPIQQATERVIEITSADFCQTLTTLKPPGATSLEFYTHLQSEFGRAMNLSFSDFEVLLKGCSNCKYLLQKAIVLPQFLIPGTQGCVKRSEYVHAMDSLALNFASTPDTTWSNYKTIVKNYLNHKWGFSFSYDQYKEFADSTNRTQLCNEPPYTSIDEDPYACIRTMIEVAYGQADRDYQVYINEERDKFRNSYINTCASAKATVDLTSKEKIYHYTLYYYDLAGNLIRTVPPEGVNILSDEELTIVDKARQFNPDLCMYNGPVANSEKSTALHDISNTLAYNGNAAVEMWFYQKDNPSGQMIVTTPDTTRMFQACINNGLLGIDIYSLRKDTLGAVSIIHSNHVTADISAIPSVNLWKHVVVQGDTLASGALQLWVNGKLYPSIAGSPTAGCGWTISPTLPMPEYITGLKHLRLYNGRLMTAQEIKANAESGCFSIFDGQNPYKYRFGVPDAGSVTTIAEGSTLETQFNPLYPMHGLRTTYAYNSSNQVIRQESPDGGTSRFWYDELSRLVISQNAKQLEGNKYSYTNYDVLGRIIEVGEKTVVNNYLTSIEQQNTPGYLDRSFRTSFLNSGTDGQLTQTVYDIAATGIGIPTGLSQSNLRKRVSASIYRDNAASTKVNASYYSYDLSGNVKTLYQQVAGLELKRLDYEYDLVSGKVNLLAYQHGHNDRFYYKYKYDAENRLREAYSSTTANIDPYGIRSAIAEEDQRLDASYQYYLHGPLARVELGDKLKKVQGLDYAYTLQGWLKGVNGNKLSGAAADIGGDGSHVAKDALAYSLGYYNGDYVPIGGSSAPAFGMNYQQAMGDITGLSLYNGNISSSTYAIDSIRHGDTFGYTYKYDQLNRLKKLRQHNLDSISDIWDHSSLNDNNYRENFNYDGNGNILALQRNSEGATMDELSYRYNRDSNGKLQNNMLSSLKDEVHGIAHPGELDGTTNYSYDAIGSLIAENKGGALVAGFDWTVYGKIKSVTKPNATENIIYTYDPAGNRVSKTINGLNTWYVRDAQGNPLAVYDGSGSTINWREQQLYGSSRLGMWKPNFNLAADSAGIKWNDAGLKFFELSNHLGNVMSVINDNRTLADGVYAPVVINAQDYYAFGSVMPGREYTKPGDSAYRYGFNGKENDNEVKGVGNQQDYGMRIYDPRIGKFLSVDPLTREYPWYTPYSYAGNMPIRFVDIDGMEQGPPKFFFEPMKYSGKNTVADYAKIIPDAATGVVNGAISLLYMASDGLNAATTAFNTGSLPFDYKDVKSSLHKMGQRVSENSKELTKKETWSADAFKSALTNPETYQQTMEMGAALYTMSRPVIGKVNVKNAGANVSMGNVSFGSLASKAAERLGFFAEEVSINGGVADIPIIYMTKVTSSDLTAVSNALRENGATAMRINSGPIINKSISGRLSQAAKQGKEFMGFKVTETGNAENMFVLDKKL